MGAEAQRLASPPDLPAGGIERGYRRSDGPRTLEVVILEEDAVEEDAVEEDVAQEDLEDAVEQTGQRRRT